MHTIRRNPNTGLWALLVESTTEGSLILAEAQDPLTLSQATEVEEWALVVLQ